MRSKIISIGKSELSTKQSHGFPSFSPDVWLYFLQGLEQPRHPIGTHGPMVIFCRGPQAQARELAENAGDFARHFEPEDWQLVQERSDARGDSLGRWCLMMFNGV